MMQVISSHVAFLAMYFGRGQVFLVCHGQCPLDEATDTAEESKIM